jgi:serine/threonine-protein kinase
LSATFDSIRAAFDGVYDIERELGAGGMATVYLARDVKHDRKVAVKVLRPELAAAMGTDRFPREIRIAAKLSHPHILPLHDSGEHGGFLYYVMPFAEGESLRARVDREGQLPVPEVVRILRELVDALAYAHSHGVVHRDIKPDNVMLSGRHALVMDFGVAKAVSDASNTDRMTTAGIALGTPTYMAPEQASADPNIDHRADIYALGVLAYELLTGKPPFGGGSAHMVLSAHMMQRPRAIVEVRPSVPASLADMVMRCLEKEPSDRWQSAEQMLPVLEALGTPSGGMTPTATAAVRGVRKSRRSWMVAAGAAVALVVAAGGGLALFRAGGRAAGRGAEAKPIQRIAVLPLQNLSGDPAQDGFADGMHDALITQMAQQQGLTVISRTSVMRYRHTDKSLADIARELNVDAVIEGSVQRSGNRVRVSANLVEAATERSLWAQSFERQGQDALGLQDELVRTMTQGIMAKLGGAPAATAAAPRTSSRHRGRGQREAA